MCIIRADLESVTKPRLNTKAQTCYPGSASACVPGAQWTGAYYDELSIRGCTRSTVVPGTGRWFRKLAVLHLADEQFLSVTSQLRADPGEIQTAEGFVLSFELK